MSYTQSTFTAEDLARALRDPAFRASLPEEIRSHIPENPAGPAELTEADLESVAGGVAEIMEEAPTHKILTTGCCDGFTTRPCW